MITFSAVTVLRGKEKILDAVSFQLAPGECLSIPCGAGASAIAELLMRKIKPTSGNITIDWAKLSLLPFPLLQIYRRSLGIVSSVLPLEDHRTVLETLSDPPASSVSFILTQCHLAPVKNKLIQDLSDGEKTLVMFARAFVRHPHVFVIDGLLDTVAPDMRKSVVRVLKEALKNGASILLCSHDASVAESLDSKLVRLNQGAPV